MPAPASAQSPALRLFHCVASATQMPDDPTEALDAAHHHAPEWDALSGGERATIEVALSLEFGRPVNLRKALTVMDHEHVSMCVDAISETAGLG